MTVFNDLPLGDRVKKAVKRAGFETPTPIQAQVIPAVLDGRDVLGLAQTGTGKTAAFVLPILDRLITNNARPTPNRSSVLILSPTRELAAQIADTISLFTRDIRLSVTLIVGGARMEPQIRNLKNGSDIIVATPGRLMDHMRSRKFFGDATDLLVLDEADQMLDMGFLPDIKQIASTLADDRQTVLMSATMPPAIRALANDLLNDPLHLSVAPSAQPIERIEQRMIPVPANQKFTALIDTLSDETVERTIVFVRTKRRADKVKDVLNDAGLKATAIHGGKTQSQRNKALDAFRKGRTPTLIATDVAARGIDVDGITHVINLDLPTVAEAYVHRIGRTGRAGRDGIAISFFDPSERNLLRAIEKLIGAKIDSDSLPEDTEHRARTSAPTKRRRPARTDARRSDDRRKQDKRGDDRRRDDKRRGDKRRDDWGSGAGHKAKRKPKWDPREQETAIASTGAIDTSAKAELSEHKGRPEKRGKKKPGTAPQRRRAQKRPQHQKRTGQKRTGQPNPRQKQRSA